MDDGASARDMLNLRSRGSDSPYVQAVWRSVADGGPMTSVACSTREIVVWPDGGGVHVAVRGPETAPTAVEVPAGHTAFGIVLSGGAMLRPLPAGGLVDDAVECPVVSRGFVLGGEEWPVPGPDSAEDLVARLVRSGLVIRDPLVDDVLAGAPTTAGTRTVERRVRAATGLSRGAVARVERARRAATLLGAGASPMDVVARLGFHDHPHLTRTLTRLVGHPPSWFRAPDAALSFPYKHDADPGS